MRRAIIFTLSLLALTACQTSDVFVPKSDYPTDPWVKGYAGQGDCQGGEALAAKNIPLPEYPSRSFNAGRQGWVIVRLDVVDDGRTENVAVERAVPGGELSSASVQAVKGWTFYPPKSGSLKSCRILFRYRLGGVTIGT